MILNAKGSNGRLSELRNAMICYGMLRDHKECYGILRNAMSCYGLRDAKGYYGRDAKEC